MGTGNNLVGQLGLESNTISLFSFIEIPILNNLNNIVFNRTK